MFRRVGRSDLGNTPILAIEEIAGMIRHIFNQILNISLAVSVSMILFMAVSITYQVILREVTGASVIWINDIVEYTLLWSTMLGSAYVLREGKHIEMDFFVSIFGNRIRLIARLATSITGFVLTSILSVASLFTVMDDYERGVMVVKTIVFPRYIVLAPVLLGLLLLAIQFFFRSLDTREELKNPTDGKLEVYDL